METSKILSLRFDEDQRHTQRWPEVFGVGFDPLPAKAPRRYSGAIRSLVSFLFSMTYRTDASILFIKGLNICRTVVTLLASAPSPFLPLLLR